MRATAGVIVALVSAAAITFAAGSSAADKAKGEFMTLPDGSAAGLTIGGNAQLVRKHHGTAVKIVVRGLQPGTTYTSHLHNDTCGATPPGGAHYKNDPGGASAPPNELWLSSRHDPTAGITPNHHGVAHGRGRAEWVARSQPLSVVVHAPGGARIACADLG